MLENNQKEIILLEDLGMRYPTNASTKKARYGLYKCYCGSEFKAIIQNIKRNTTTSCGCYNKQRIKECKTTHNLTHHRLFQTWANMINRCSNPKRKDYSYYGGRGISVSKEWLSVENFIEDMYPSYQEGLTLDRENPNGNYNKDNCRWVSRNTQSENTRKIRSSNTSGYRGSSWCAEKNKWVSQIQVNRKKIHIGTFNTAIDGAKAYDNYIIKHNLEHTKNF